jgi:hypothetical protein
VSQERLPARAAAAVAGAWLEVLGERHPDVRWTLVTIEPVCTPSSALGSESMENDDRDRSD